MSAERDDNHQVLNIYREQTETYHNARRAVLEDLDVDEDEVSEGEVVKRLAAAYTGYEVDDQ